MRRWKKEIEIGSEITRLGRKGDIYDFDGENRVHMKGFLLYLRKGLLTEHKHCHFL